MSRLYEVFDILFVLITVHNRLSRNRSCLNLLGSILLIVFLYYDIIRIGEVL